MDVTFRKLCRHIGILDIFLICYGLKRLKSSKYKRRIFYLMFCDNKNVGYDPHTEVKHNLINKTKTAFNFNSKTVQKQKTVKMFSKLINYLFMKNCEHSP